MHDLNTSVYSGRGNNPFHVDYPKIYILDDQNILFNNLIIYFMLGARYLEGSSRPTPAAA